MNKNIIFNPYEKVDWDACEYIHSMSHQHGGQWTDSGCRESMEEFYDMGFRHMAVSNYYPSEPSYPLPVDFSSPRPDAIGCPNAEHHSFTDIEMHVCALGSWYATGYGKAGEPAKVESSPARLTFKGLTPFGDKEKWLGIYRLDLVIMPKKGGVRKPVSASLTIEGALECDRKRFAVRGSGEVRNKPVKKSTSCIYIRSLNKTVTATVEFDDKNTEIVQFRLMQGTNRPFRDALAAALDGNKTDDQGTPVEGLVYKNGGGITINHPDLAAECYFPVLDYDKRVLGVEVWNHRRGFGLSRRNLHAYKLWDEILSTGRKCFGFFVKDHRRYGQGRNVLILPRSLHSPVKKEHAALKAYREGCFFGSLGAQTVDRHGETVNPYDYTEFRFKKIIIRNDKSGKPAGIEVNVGGHNREIRSNIQIRFITDRGISKIADNDDGRAFFPLSENNSLRFVRVEAFAYPDRLEDGQTLNGRKMRDMDVGRICFLHDRVTDKAPNDRIFKFQPIPVIDMIFSQPLMFNVARE